MSEKVQGALDIEQGSPRTQDEELYQATKEAAHREESDSVHSEADRDAGSIRSIGGQTNTLSPKRLVIAIPALSVALFVSFIDSTSVSTSIPAISAALNTGTATSWIGSSFLVSSTAFQLINGRLSDIFGRKNCLLLCLALLAIGDFGCGFSRSQGMLFAFRSIAGIGGGGINSLAMIIVSDIVTIEDRGKYQGIFGAVIALANGTGPFVGGALVDSVSWHWVFWIVPMLAVPAALLIFFFLPLKYERANYKEKVKKIDYGGIFLNLAAVLLILIPLSGGGVQYPWDSPLVIAMLVVGGCTAVAFVLYEWKIAEIPIMPVRLVKYPYCWSLYAQNFFTGMCFFGNFFYLPIYFQSVLGLSALVSGALLLPLILATSFTGIVSGQIMSRRGRYRWICVSGFVLWTLGTGLKCAFNRSTKIWHIVLVLVVEGMGIGNILQSTLVAILANGSNSDRAVATGLRNFIRTIGGAFGLIISGAILANILDTRLSHLPFMTPEILQNLTSSTYSLDKLGFDREEMDLVLDTYVVGIRYIYILYAASAATNLVLCAWIGNTSLKVKPTTTDKVEVRNERAPSSVEEVLETSKEEKANGD
ncbi:hypothetical protein DPSP01_002631 [Paraphaeosphaeria sporulosa]